MRGSPLLFILLAAAVSTWTPACGLLFNRKVDLQDKPVQAVRIELAPEAKVCPGRGVPVVLTAVLADGSELKTRGGGGDVGWDNYQLEWTGGAVESASGGGRLLVLSADPMATWGTAPALHVASAHHPDIKASVQLPVAYDCSYAADFSGPAGRDGRDGAFGRSGSHGKDEQTSPSYAKPGGRGASGGRGGNGADGEPGQRGDDVDVWVGLFQADGGAPLLQVHVESLTRDRQARYLLDARAGSLVVRANGGHGGRGGHGGSGASGGSGGTGVPPGGGGSGGDGGDGGQGADGAGGGRITVHADKGAKPYLDRLSYDNGGGGGGAHGNAGSPGSGGNAPSGASAGQRGQWGQQGSRDGRGGAAGPKPVIRFETVKPWAPGPTS